MSSSKTIEELRQKRDKMQADVNGMKGDLATRQKRIADLESQILALGEDYEGNFIRLARFMEATKDMETLKKQSEELIKSLGSLLSDCAGYLASLHNSLCDHVKTMNEIDEKWPRKGGKTFQQELDEGLATLKK